MVPSGRGRSPFAGSARSGTIRQVRALDLVESGVQGPGARDSEYWIRVWRNVKNFFPDLV
jgi:hypothetical protein